MLGRIASSIAKETQVGRFKDIGNVGREKVKSGELRYQGASRLWRSASVA